MPNWKKVITSGSDATVKTLLISDTADGDALIGNNNILHEGSNTTATNLTVGTATNSTNATNATNVTTAAESTNAERFVTFAASSAATQQLKTDAGIKYNPSSNTVTVGRVAGTDIDAGSVTVSDSFDLRAGNGGIGTSGGLTSVGITNSSTYGGGGRLTLTGGASSYIEATGYISSSVSVNAPTGSFEVLVGDTSQPTSLEVDGHITASGNISSSGYVYSKNAQYWSTTGRVTVGNNTTNYYGPNPQGTNYYYWSRDLGTSSTTITSKTTTLNSGWKLPYKAVLTGYHLNIQGRSTTDNIEFTLVYSDGMWDGDVTSLSQTLVEAESGQTVTISAQNNFYELDRRGQFAIPVSAMTMLYPRFKKTAATGGTSYDFQLAVEYYVVQ